MSYLPTTELEAVNMMLNYIGDPPVNSLDDIEETEAAVAYRLLTQTSREVQAQGHPWNTFTLDLVPDETGVMALPANTLQAHCADLRYMAMDGKVYDRKENTFTLSRLKLRFSIARYLEWETLPELARNYILLAASRLFMENAVGSSDMVNMISQQLSVAERELKDFDLKLEGPALFDTFDQMVIARGISPQNRGLPWR